MARKESAEFPEGTRTIPAKVVDSQGREQPAQVVIKQWSSEERRKRAWSRSLKPVGWLLLVTPLCLLVHLLLLVITLGWMVMLAGFIPLLAKFMREQATFFVVDGPCPYCGEVRALRPYLSTELQPQVTVLCRGCGQTAQAFPELSGLV